MKARRVRVRDDGRIESERHKKSERWKESKERTDVERVCRNMF